MMAMDHKPRRSKKMPMCHLHSNEGFQIAIEHFPILFTFIQHLELYCAKKLMI